MAFAEYPVLSSGGGITKVADSTERNALTPADGDIVIQLDNDFLYEWNGSSWAVLADRTWQTAGSILGAKTFDTASRWSVATNQQVFGATNTTTVNYAAPSANRIYTVPDVGADAAYVLTVGNQTIGGTKTFSSAVVINPTTNQIVLGITNTTTINSVAPSASRVYTIPDVGADAIFVMTAGAQTIGALKTFSQGIAVTGGTSAAGSLTRTGTTWVIGNGPTITEAGAATFNTSVTVGSTNGVDLAAIDSSTGSGSVRIRSNNASANARDWGLLLDANTAGELSVYVSLTKNGNPNLGTGVLNLTSSVFRVLDVQAIFTRTTNQLVLGTTNTTTISATAPAASRVYTLPDVGGAAEFIMSAGTQTIAGTKTFSSTISGSITGNAETVTNGIYNGGNSYGSALTIGTNDNFGLNLETNGTNKLTISSAGAISGGPSAGGVDHAFYGNLHRFNQNATLTAPSGVYADTTSQSDVRLLLANQLNATQVNGFRLRTSTDGSNNTALVFEGANTASTTIGGLSFSEFVRVSHLGAVTLGPSSGGSLTHTIRANGDSIVDVVCTASGTARLKLRGLGAGAAGIDFDNGSLFLRAQNGAVDAGNISSAGAWTLGPSSSSSTSLFHTFLLPTADSYSGANFTNQPSNSIVFSSGSGQGLPVIRGKNTANNVAGLFLSAASSDTNSFADMVFNVRQNNNGDFSTLTNNAFAFSRFGTDLATVTRAGAWTLGPSAGGVTHRFNTNTSTTATGGSRTLPANPVDFWTVNINGTDRKIPYYAT